MTPQTLTLRDGREAELVPGDDAGVFLLAVADGVVNLAEAQGLLTWRQAEALRTLQRRYRASGGRVAWQQHFAGRPRPEAAEEAGKAAWLEMHHAVPARHRCHLITLVQGEWPVTISVREVQGIATRLADVLRLAPEGA